MDIGYYGRYFQGDYHPSPPRRRRKVYLLHDQALRRGGRTNAV
ncbi:hypothetical protein DSBG_0179 [Desulfosporosinus sp. BG]|nr:hypothetical protein DSBG_0179 [Desulfosporosinus sp. BG]